MTITARTILFSIGLLLCWPSSAALSAGIPVKDARVVAYLCSAGISAQIQGDVDAAIARILKIGEASGRATVDSADLTGVLEQFSGDSAKKEVYKAFTSCVISLVNGLKEARPGDQEATPVSDDRVLVPDPLVTIKRGQRFAMKVGENRLLTESQVLMRLTKIEKKYDWVQVKFSYKTGDKTRTIQIGSNYFLQPIECRIELYGVDRKNKAASFRMLCPDDQ